MLPLYLIRHSLQALDVAMSDLSEAASDDDLDEDTKSKLEGYHEIIGNIGAGLINLVSQEMGEEEFMAVELPPLEMLDNEPEIDITDELVEEE